MDAHAERFTRPGLGGVRLAAIRRGDPARPALVLLHGAGANAHWWDHLAPKLAVASSVTALDFRGHGESDHPAELREGAFSDDLDALLEHLEADAPVLVGHSLGGHVALEHAARNPRTRGLVLIDVARGTSARRRRATRLALGFRRSYATRAEAVARFRFVPRAPYASEALRRHIAGHSVREEPGGRFGYRFDPRWLAVPGRRPSSEIHCPTLLIRGAESPLLTPEGADELGAEIPGLRLATVEKAGHHAHLDQPERVLELLREFLAALA